MEQFISGLIPPINSIGFYVLILSLVVWTMQLFYYLYFYVHFNKLRNKPKTSPPQFPVSVIISARNEAQNLKKNLPYILEQNYPEFEVIVVNDASTDNSEEILSEMQLKYKNLYVTKIVNDMSFSHGKKLALTIGIKAAKNEWMLFTDADCVPASKNWIATMQKNFTNDMDIVIGYGAYNRNKGLLNKLIRYDALFIAIQYFSFAYRKMPYMGVGRNLAYRKSFFFKNKGFASHHFLLSGDDDLFVNQNATAKNFTTEINPESFTISSTFDKFRHWNFQKQRHFSTAPYYKKKHVIFLAAEPSSRFIFYATTVFLLFNSYIWSIGLLLILIRLTIQLLVLNKAIKIVNEKSLLVFGIFFDILLLLFNFTNYNISKIRGKKLTWK